MFLDEARIASQLHHGNIVAVLDYGVDQGHPFQVLEFVDGLDLSQLRALGRRDARAADPPASLPPALALAICTNVAHALAHAHAAVGVDGHSLGIVHRDVSPANILVSWSGDVKLGDFGIAFARGRLETTQAGLAKGTLAYMAPEQIMRGEIDGRSDLFALGCVLHALIAGASPLAGENAMADLIAGAPLALAPELPDDVRAIVARATRLARSDRFAGATEMAAALGAALAARIATDPRSLLSEWLARIRAEPVAPPPGKLDAPLGVGHVFSGVRATEGAGATDSGFAETPARRRFHRAKVAAALLPAAIGIGALVAWPRTQPVATVPDGPRPAVVAVPAPDAAPAATPAPAPPAPVAASATPRPRPRRVAAPADPGSGVIAIGGQGAVKAEILVDGQSLGYAPKLLDLPVGEHECVLVQPGGHRLSRTLRVLATHTPSQPLRWVVP
jgi:serine/threonine-protein kinase